MLQQQQAPSFLEVSSPISGRSRFSKALPSVPGFFHDDTPLPKSKELPNPPPPPPPPPPYTKDDDSKSSKSSKSTITRKPISYSPMPPPPLPSKSVTSPLDTPLKSSSSFNSSSSSTTHTPTSVMAIPRRPVGALQPSTPAKSPQYLAQPSPTDSLSSLLSAYSREPDELPLGGGTGATVAGSNSNNSTVYATERRTSPAGNQATLAAPATANGTLQTRSLRDQKLPAPPPKDGKPLPSPRPISPSSKPQPAVPELSTPSPPRPEIWRRRPHKSDDSRELPGLRLDYSHGSTASTTTTPVASSEAATAATPSSSSSSSRSLSSQRSQGSTETIKATPTPTPQARPAVVGLPGRNIRPAAKQQQQKQQVAETSPAMGSGASKLKHLKDNLPHSRSPHKDTSATKTGHAPSRPGAQRPPTPEYHNGDVKAAPAVDTFVSPVSPASSSGSPKIIPADASSKALPSQPPRSAVEQLQSKPLPRKTLPPSAPNLQGAASLQDLGNKNSSMQSPASSSKATSRRESPANDSGSSRAQESAESAKFPPRTSSVKPDAQRPLERPRHSAPDGADPRIVHSETQGPLYRGRDGTLYPEMKNTREPDPRAAYFPAQAERLLEPGTVIPAKPLKVSHFSCYQNHRTMNRRTNRHYPLTCQTCDKADAEDRWVCTFCHLRVCESCLRALNGHQRVLRRLVDELAMDTPLSLSSTSRPGSALGLQLAT